eukprot:s5676_g7.t1
MNAVFDMFMNFNSLAGRSCEKLASTIGELLPAASLLVGRYWQSVKAGYPSFRLRYLVAACIPRLRLNKDVVVGTSVFNAFFISVMNLSLTLFQTYRNPTGEWSMISAPSVLTSSDVWQSLVYATAVAVVIYGVGAAAGSAYAIAVAPSKFKVAGYPQYAHELM